MHIAFLTDGIHPYVIGGMQSHSFNLTKYFARNGVYVDLFHCVPANQPIIETLECFTKEENKFITNFCFHFPEEGKLIGHYVRNSYLYADMLFKSIQPNLDKYNFICTKGFAGLTILKKKNEGLKCPPISVQLHGLEMFQPSVGVKSYLSSLMLQKPALKVLKYADVIFTYGAKIKELHKSLGFPEEKLIENHGAVNDFWLKDFSPSQRKEKIGFVFVGRHERRKGIPELNFVLNKLDKNQFDFHFVGDIPEDKRIQSPNLFYHGIQTAEKIKEINQANDVLVVPSLSEGFPTVIVEAMACGMAIIATDVGAVQRVVSDKNGWIIPPADRGKLEVAMSKAIELDPQSLFNKKLYSRKVVEDEFTWDKMIKAVIQFIEDYTK
jgi:glycosyltransferase involved in cell wall biosynthesis